MAISDGPAARKFIVSLKQIAGEIARWACRQSPYGLPDNLGAVLTAFYERAAADFTLFTRSPRDGWREFESRDELQVYIARALVGSGFEAWNEPKNQHGAPFVAVSRYGGPQPDDDFIDLYALVRNIAMALVDEERREYAADHK